MADAHPPRRDTALARGSVFAGRLLVIGAAIAGALWVASVLSNVVLPLMVGIVVAALLVPFSTWMQRHHVPRWAAITLSLLTVPAGVAALVFLVFWRVSESLPALQSRTVALVGQVQRFLQDNPLGLPKLDIDTSADAVRSFVQEHATQLEAGVAVAGGTIVELGEGLFIAVFVVVFALTGGRRMWEWAVTLFPQPSQPRLRIAGEAGWETLTHFIRVQVVIAATDALGIGLGAFFLGLPLAAPIGVVVFVGAFIPVVGAFAAGAVAVAIALLFKGWVVALVMLGIVVLVQQLEGEVLHPFLTGSIVAVHPLGVLVAVIAGTTVAGIPGGFFAVPIVSVANSMIRAARHDTTDVEEALPIPATAAKAAAASTG